MIVLSDVSKIYRTRHGSAHVLQDVQFTIERGDRLALIGRNGAGKSTLIRMISGAERPTTGRIERSMSVSWPLAFSGAFQGSLTGLDNVRFICRVYDVPFESKLQQVEDFCELGKYLREPVKTYSSGMRARLAFAISLVVEFDCFLIDEVVAVGDERFLKKCEFELFEKRADRAYVVASHSTEMLRRYCTRAAVVRDGQVRVFEELENGLAFYEEPVAG